MGRKAQDSSPCSTPLVPVIAAMRRSTGYHGRRVAATVVNVTYEVAARNRPTLARYTRRAVARLLAAAFRNWLLFPSLQDVARSIHIGEQDTQERVRSIIGRRLSSNQRTAGVVGTGSIWEMSVGRTS